MEEAEKYLLKGIELCERLNEKGWNMIAHSYLAMTYFEIGNFRRSKDYYEKVCRLLEHSRLMPSYAGWAKIGAARSRVMNNEEDVDLESLYAHLRNNKIKRIGGENSKYIGEILLNIDDQHFSEAEHWIQNAIESDQRNQMMFSLGRDYALYTDLFKRKGDRFKAKENLGKAIEIFKECGADGWVEKAERELASI